MLKSGNGHVPKPKKATTSGCSSVSSSSGGGVGKKKSSKSRKVGEETVSCEQLPSSAEEKLARCVRHVKSSDVALDC